MVESQTPGSTTKQPGVPDPSQKKEWGGWVIRTGGGVGWVGVVGVVLGRYKTGLVLYETRRKENEEKKWRLWDSNQNFKIKTMIS